MLGTEPRLGRVTQALFHCIASILIKARISLVGGKYPFPTPVCLWGEGECLFLREGFTMCF